MSFSFGFQTRAGETDKNPGWASNTISVSVTQVYAEDAP